MMRKWWNDAGAVNMTGEDQDKALDNSGQASLPPSVVASPNWISEESDEPVTWWQPDWSEALRYVGYRWIFLTPAVALVGLLVAGLVWPSVWDVLFVLGFKLLLLMVGVTVSLAGYVVRRAVQARTEPFCIFCGYNLTGLPDHYRCPECGRPYDWALIAEYRRDPRWFIERWRLRRKLPASDVPFPAGPVCKRRGRRDGTA
jgi:hypothetical protein